MNEKDIALQTSAAYLYDGGWRKEDEEQLIAEYGLSEEDVRKICEFLAEFEERAKEEEE